MHSAMKRQCCSIDTSTTWKPQIPNARGGVFHRYRVENLRISHIVLISATVILNYSSKLVHAALTSMRTEAFDTVDSVSFCDARRFEIVEGTSGIIYSHTPYYPASTYRAGRDCFMTLRAPPGYRLELVALEFQVGERYAASSRRCAGDSLHIFDQDKPDILPKRARSQPGQYQDENSLSAILSSNSSVASPIKANLCGRLKNNTVIARSTMNIITLWWHSEPDASPSPRTDRLIVSSTAAAKRGFKLQWSAFRESSGSSGCDQETEFACTNQNICIPVELACDSVAHCDDKSDLLPDRQRSVGCENVDNRMVSPSGPFTIGTLAGICVGAALLLVLALVLFSVCRKRHRLPRGHHKYNPAPGAAFTAPLDSQFVGDGRAAATATTTSTNKSSNSSNSDNSRGKLGSNELQYSADRQMVAHQLLTAYPVQQQHNMYHQRIDSNTAGIVMPNGISYYRHYIGENGAGPYQPKSLHHNHYHHHAQLPNAPPPSVVGGTVGTSHQNVRHQLPSYQQPRPQQQAAALPESHQLIIA